MQPGPQGLIGLGQPAALRPYTPTQGVRYDPVASAYFAAMTGSPLTAEKKGWINAAVVAWRAAGLLPLIGHLCLPLQDSQASRLNLINPSDPMEILSNSPAFTPFRGFQGDSSLAEIDSLYPLDGTKLFSQNSGTIYATINATMSDSAIDTAVAGIDTVTGTLSFLRPRNSSGFLQGRVNAGTTSVGASVGTRLGRFAISRTDSTTTTLYLNGGQSGSVSNFASAAPQAGKTLRWFRLGSTYGGDRVALRMIGAGMSALQIAEFDAIARQLMTQLGAQ